NIALFGPQRELGRLGDGSAPAGDRDDHRDRRDIRKEIAHRQIACCRAGGNAVCRSRRERRGDRCFIAGGRRGGSPHRGTSSRVTFEGEMKDWLTMPGSDAVLNNYLIVGALLFTLGLVGFLARRNLIIMFLCAELMLQGVSLTLVAFSAFHN